MKIVVMYHHAGIAVAVADEIVHHKISEDFVRIEDFFKVLIRAELFERFYKSAASKSDSFGIGLALAKKIIESNNGNISVDRMDVGTKFAIKYFKF